MQRHQLHSFQPYFKIQETKHGESAQYVHLTREIIGGMIDTGYFSVGSIVIPVSKDSGLVSINLHLTNDKRKPHPFSGFPISGFPRNLAEGDPIKRTSKALVIYHNIYTHTKRAAASSPAPSEADRSSLAQKRQSLRRKRTIRARFTDNNERPVSIATSSGSGRSSNSVSLGYPDSADSVSEWIRRRHEARRAPPKPVQDMEPQVAYELDGSSLPEPFQDEDDKALAEAVERSQRPPLTRTPTGTDEDELQRVLLMSLVEK